MAETAVSFALGQVFQLLKEETNYLSGIHKEFSDIKDELESIQAFLKDADRKAADEANTNHGIRTWVKQLREASFRIEDVIDEYLCLMRVAHHHRAPCGTLICKIPSLVRTLIPCHQIVSEIRDIKLTICGIKERSQRYNFQISHPQGSSKGDRWRDPRMPSLFIEETEIVGFDVPRDELLGWLLEGSAERTVISVVGMGGIGKTTLAKHVFDSEKVTRHFDCHACIAVSQSYTVRGLLVDMMEQFCKETKYPLPQMMHEMDDRSLITEVRQYLQHKRYLILFDDVWHIDFSDQVEFAFPNNDRGGRIIITTRIVHVAEFFKKSFPVRVHSLQLLPPNKAWELFCKKAFRFEFDGHCPPDLEHMSKEIVKKCTGLPLAIVAIEDYSINHRRLTRQWIAEGFVKPDEKRTLEQVAEEYLSELIYRSLVQISKVGFEGKVKTCQVHDMLREVITRKVKDLSFCHYLPDGDEESVTDTVGITRRLSITTSSSNNMFKSTTSNSHIHAIHVVNEESMPDPLMDRLSSKSRMLKVLDFEGTSLNSVPNNLGKLFHLRYINLQNTEVRVLPKSIGKLQNLETLDITRTQVHELPSEINKLTKLRHLLAFHRNYKAKYSVWGFTTGVLMKKGIENLTSLQNLYYLEVEDQGAVDLIQEMRMLRQLRKLGLRHVRREHGNALCGSVVEMKHLETLNITAINEDEIIDLNSISSLPQLRRLILKARLDKLPPWIPKLEYLVKIRLALSNLKDDPLKLLKDLPNLLNLCMCDNAYGGQVLHFQNGGFPKLKELYLARLNRVNSIVIDRGALICLEQFRIEIFPQLMEVPSGIKHLNKLNVIDFVDMPDKFVESIDPEIGQDFWIIKNVPQVLIRCWIGPKFSDFEIRTIHSSSTQLEIL